MAEERTAGPTWKRTMEEALLPQHLPDVPGWSISTVYQPAGEAVLVGGDFFDWFARPDGAYGFLLGDVAGKGQVAAVTGMAVRKGLKALSWAVPDVCEAVRLLERAMADDLERSFVSFCYIELRAAGKVRLLSAGHPPPWLVSGGRATEVPVHQNALFGLDLVDRWVADEVELSAGDMLLVFSDGLIEARLEDGRLFGEGSLQRLLNQLRPGLRSWELAAALAEPLGRSAVELRDDLVVAVLQRTA